LLKPSLKINVGYAGNGNPLNANETLAETHMGGIFQPTYGFGNRNPE